MDYTEDQGTETDQHELDEAEAKATLERLSALGQRLIGDVRERINKRKEVERRWIADLARYNSQYDPDSLKSLEARRFGSKVFVPLTRRVCNILEARLSDLLFPTDDRNFAVDSSPKPDLVDALSLAKKLKPDTPVNAQGQQLDATSIKLAIQDLIDEAKKKAGGMQRAVDDSLKESDYPSVAREVIHDAIVIGTGVIKGPHPLLRTKRAWSVVDGVAQMQVVENAAPTVVRVDPWHFYPETGVADMAHNGSVFEVHELSKLEMVRLAEQPGFDEEAIREIVSVPPSRMTDSTLAERRLASGTGDANLNKYRLYEYHGPIDAEDLRACGCDDVDDELMVLQACVFLDEGGRVIKAKIEPLDTEEIVYSVFNWQKDTASVFGYGVPYELGDLQESANSSFRAALDNMGLSVGPMVVVDDAAIAPVNGEWAIEPNKLWRKTDRTQQVAQAFGFFQIDSKVAELMQVFTACVQMLNEIGGPAMATQGQEAIVSVRTDFQASMAYASASVWMRRAVKLWDDQITVPLIRRFVDWHMQYNPDPEIKGDFNVIARGTSALLEAEGQVQRVAMLMKASAEAGIPIRRVVNQLRSMARSMRLDPDELLPSDDEVAAMEKKQAEQGPPPNPEIERIRIREMEIADNAEERAHKEKLAEASNQMRLAEIASRENITSEQARQRYGVEAMKIEATLADSQAEREHDAQKVNAELAIKARMGSGV